MCKIEFLLCPVCGSKTRIKLRPDTVLENFPLFCPKCKQETLITVKELYMYGCTTLMKHLTMMTILFTEVGKFRLYGKWKRMLTAYGSWSPSKSIPKERRLSNV